MEFYFFSKKRTAINNKELDNEIVKSRFGLVAKSSIVRDLFRKN